MGYYTYFELDLVSHFPEDVDFETMKTEIGDISGYGDRMFDGASIKWYNHDEDMKNFSKKYPDIVFELSGSGEDPGDMWVCYYQNGKMQYEPAKISFDPFDVDKLV